jgi:hypothetical protein
VSGYIHSNLESRTETASAGASAIVLNACLGPLGCPTVIRLKHRLTGQWCAAGGVWTHEAHRAVKFPTNIDALLFCKVLRVPARIVAHDAYGLEVYALDVENMLGSLVKDRSAAS